MLDLHSSCRCAVLVLAPLATLCAELPQEARTAIDRITGGKGVYAADEKTYKVVFPREAAAIVQDWQNLSPNAGLNSWVAMSPGVHHPASMTGQYLLLDDEVADVVSAVVDSGIEVTGLAALTSFDGPRLRKLDVTGRGSVQQLATAFRKGLDAITEARRRYWSIEARSRRPEVPLESDIDSRALDAVLSMRGTVVGGAYKASIGMRALLNGEQVGREMGFATSISVTGTNDSAVVAGEFVERQQDLQKVLKAILASGLHIDSIRNHTMGEHPQVVFVQFWSEGKAIELARMIRYVLDVEVGAPSLSEVIR